VHPVFRFLGFLDRSRTRATLELEAGADQAFGATAGQSRNGNRVKPTKPSLEATKNATNDKGWMGVPLLD
jgi:hypothetical protein